MPDISPQALCIYKIWGKKKALDLHLDLHLKWMGSSLGHPLSSCQSFVEIHHVVFSRMVHCGSPSGCENITTLVQVTLTTNKHINTLNLHKCILTPFY